MGVYGQTNYAKGMFLFWFLILYSMWRHYFAVATDTITSCSLGRWYGPVYSLSFLDVYGSTQLGPILNNFLRPKFTDFRNKVDCLSLASLSSLV